MEICEKFSRDVSGLEASAIREIFKMLTKPGIISFAGGAPAAELFPNEIFAKISSNILKTNGNMALNYGITEGYAPLRAWVVDYLKTQKIAGENDDTIIVSGGQQGLALLATALLNSGDTVVCERPSFIGGLNALRARRAKIIDVEVLEDGLDLVAFENILKTEKVKLLYTIPTFQNPSGITMSLEKRKKLLALAEKYDFIILEDNPYESLRFEGAAVQTIKSLDTFGRVVYVGSFSKILAPGLRVGYACADKKLMERMIICKQIADVHTSCLPQMMVHEFLTNYDINAHIELLCKVYKERCTLMLDGIKKHFRDDIKYTKPQGGLFIYCTMPENFDSKEVLQKALLKNVAFVPGNACVVNDKVKNSSFRLNFSAMPNDKIELGIELLGKTLSEL